MYFVKPRYLAQKLQYTSFDLLIEHTNLMPNVPYCLVVCFSVASDDVPPPFAARGCHGYQQWIKGPTNWLFVGALSPDLSWWTDAITAFVIEDNNLWLRHLLNPAVQISLVLYIFRKSTN